MRYVAYIFTVTAVSTLVALGVTEIFNHHGGIYAGMDYVTAQHHARDALVVTYGKEFTGRLRYAEPPVVNTHFNNALTGVGQVREFHLVGPGGVRYCVSVWDPRQNWIGGRPGDSSDWGINVGARYVVQKGCKF